MGLDRQRAHDDRYDLAEEYMAVAYKLWEGLGRRCGQARPGSGCVRRSGQGPGDSHEGPAFPVEGVHLGEPSPQRTPVIYQAGTSPKGAGFAARHAECVFVSVLRPR